MSIYDKFVLFAIKMNKKGRHDKGSMGLGLKSSVDGLRGRKKNSSLKTQLEEKHRLRQTLRSFREPELGRLGWSAGHGQGNSSR